MAHLCKRARCLRRSSEKATGASNAAAGSRSLSQRLDSEEQSTKLATEPARADIPGPNCATAACRVVVRQAKTSSEQDAIAGYEVHRAIATRDDRT